MHNYVLTKIFDCHVVEFFIYSHIFRCNKSLKVTNTGNLTLLFLFVLFLSIQAYSCSLKQNTFIANFAGDTSTSWLSYDTTPLRRRASTPVISQPSSSSCISSDSSGKSRETAPALIAAALPG